MKKGKMMTKSKKSVLALVVLALIALCLVMTSSMTGFAGLSYVENSGLSDNGKFYADYATYADAQAAAAELNLELSREGNVLLKNDGSLPFIGGDAVSVFGVRSDAFTGGSGTLSASLSNAGFRVNPTLTKYYADDSSGIGAEKVEKDFTAQVKKSIADYNDAAVVFISRTGGEANDCATVTAEVEDEKGPDGTYGWTHEDLADGKDSKNNDVKFKHYLQLTDSEEELVSYVKKNFDKIVVVINTSNIIETYNLENDPAINGILWIGRPGAAGINAVGEILSGSVNPSGRTVDEWYRDFTADPTWQNFGTQAGTNTNNLYYYENGIPTGDAYTAVAYGRGMHGVDYEEDIYFGYRYYETYWQESLAGNTDTLPADANQWHADNVVYPFGHGLSYTEFSYSMGGVYTDASKTTDLSGTTISGSIFASAPNDTADVKTLYIPVTVKNEGDVAGKEVVQLYVTAPYTGKLEKSFVNFVGFGKTRMLKPGESQTLNITFEVQDMASFDTEGVAGDGYDGFKLEEGIYTIRAMKNSHVDETIDAYDAKSFTIDDGDAVADCINLKLDDYSGNYIESQFSSSDGIYYSVRDGKLNKDESAKMTLLKRDDMDGTFPKSPTMADKIMKNSFITEEKAMLGWNAATQTNYNAELTDTASSPWYISPADFAAASEDWTQQVRAKDVMADKMIREMAGIPLYTGAVDNEWEFNDKWNEFVNQLTWEEMTELVSNGSFRNEVITSIGKSRGITADGPNSFAGHSWCCENVISATYNVQLARTQGVVVANLAMLRSAWGTTSGLSGWYGPGANLHRTPFSGRNNEYYSQDGIQGGLMAAAVVGGAESRGLNCWIKHFYLNDQEANRNGLYTWATEQVQREIYMPLFQKAMQEGGASATMTAFNKIGRVIATGNYNLMTNIVKKQWGFLGSSVTDMFAGYTAGAFTDKTSYAGADVAEDIRERFIAALEIVKPIAQWTASEKEFYEWPRAMFCSTDLNVRAGNELPLGLTTGNNAVAVAAAKATGTWNAKATSNADKVIISGTEKENNIVTSYMQYYYVRMCATRLLYQYANSTDNRNGVNVVNYAGLTKKIPDATVGSSISKSVAVTAADLNKSTATYSITSGSLPAGLSLSAAGTVSGRPTTPGKYSFTVTALIDKWMRVETTYTLDVALDAAWTKSVASLDVGKSYTSSIISDTFGGYAVSTYSISGGALPAGLTLSANGVLSGTPAEKGIFNFTVNVAVKEEDKSNATVYNFSFNETMVVSNADYSIVSADINSKGELVVTYTDGTTENLGVIKGIDGTNGLSAYEIAVAGGYTGTIEEWVASLKGAAGTPGAPGADGKDGKDGKDGADAEGGCGSTIAGGVGIALIAVIAGAMLICLKKGRKEEK